jgi:hypothetical protein
MLTMLPPNLPFSLIETKLGTNVRWMFMFMFFVDQKYTKETRGPKVSKSVYPTLGTHQTFS